MKTDFGLMHTGIGEILPDVKNILKSKLRHDWRGVD